MMLRRDFLLGCAASTTGLVGALGAVAESGESRRYGRVKLVDEGGQPVRLALLKRNTNYIFEYPFEATPCFLVHLDQPAGPVAVPLRTQAGGEYRWAGGVGPERALVAYSAICAHKLAYPSKQVSFISFQSRPGPKHKEGKVIACCADGSVYDATAGARVMAGPAPQPLATILLEYDAKADEIHAIGTLGGEKFNEFFSKYEFRLQLEMGKRARNAAAVSSVVRELTRYSTQSASC
jgi:Rieske Fe-S protein